MDYEHAPETPTQYLATCLAVIRGGKNVPVELIEQDVARWIEAHGPITEESVDKWAADDFELKFGLDLLRQRFAIEDC